jgi:cbb3-type cytochrome oxidase maturation protein
MESLYLLIPIAAIFCVLIIRLFIWSVDNKQFDDLDRESRRIFEEDDSDSLS